MRLVSGLCRFFVFTILVATVQKLFTLAEQKHILTIGAFFLRGQIPRGELALRITLTAIEGQTVFTVLNDNGRLTVGAKHGKLFRFLLYCLTYYSELQMTH